MCSCGGLPRKIIVWSYHCVVSDTLHRRKIRFDALQTLVNICATEFEHLDMAINVNKSACMRFGFRFKNHCANITVSGLCIEWVTSTRYLGVYLESSTRFKCSFSHNKASFYKAFNSILVKLVVWPQKRSCLH